MFSDMDGVLFDLDGTLLDSAPDLAAAVDKLRTDRGLPSLPIERYRPMVGAGARGMLGVAFGMQADHPEFESHKDEFFINYESCLSHRTAPFEGISELIQALVGRGMPWGVVTNKATRFTQPLTSAMPLFSTAGAIISGDTTPHAKPHPEPLFEAARRMGVDPRRCVYVGDDRRDIVAGLAAGMRTVAALYGYLGEHNDAAAWGAHAAVQDAKELLPLLLGH
jgi:phosphoglycolate phosphatase